MQIQNVVPVLRIFDDAKVKEFYVDWLGFKIEWEHRFAENMPLYMEVSFGGIVLHLSEHYGDCSPGAKIFLECTGLKEYHQMLSGKNYMYYKPEVIMAPWGGNALVMELTDPFGNRITFKESLE